MLRGVFSLGRPSLRSAEVMASCFSSKKFKVIENPADVSKLVFNEEGLCKIYEYKLGEHTLRKVVRYITSLTIINGFLFGLEQATPSTPVPSKSSARST
jgi:hypothetical protein